MCVPKEYRSIEGAEVEAIYNHFQETGLCSIALDPDFVNYMSKYDGRLRRSGKTYDVMVAVEKYATDWNKDWDAELRKYVMKDFHNFLQRRKLLQNKQPGEALKITLSWLYFYVGMAALDEASRPKP